MSDAAERIHPSRDPARALARWNGTPTVAPRQTADYLAEWTEPRAFKAALGGWPYWLGLVFGLFGHLGNVGLDAPLGDRMHAFATAGLWFVAMWSTAILMQWLCFGGWVTLDPMRREIVLTHPLRPGSARIWSFDDITQAQVRRGMVAEDAVRLRLGRRRLRFRVPLGHADPLAGVLRRANPTAPVVD